jgi:hypothetical protein
MTEPFDFQECAECAAKPGSPPLCPSCLHNRELISKFKGDVNARIVCEIGKLEPKRGDIVVVKLKGEYRGLMYDLVKAMPEAFGNGSFWMVLDPEQSLELMTDDELIRVGLKRISK